MTGTFYLIRNGDHNYSGATSQPFEDRLAQHNQQATIPSDWGTPYTHRVGTPGGWEEVDTISFDTSAEAFAYERQYKNSRKWAAINRNR